MIKISLKVAIIVLLAITTNSLFAQDDEGECKDHPLFNRLPNYFLAACSENFNEFEIVIANGEKQVISGNVFNYEYVIKDGVSKFPSAFQIIKNYENAVLAKGGQKIYVATKRDDDGFIGATFKLKNKEANYWVTLYSINDSDGGSDMYKISIIKIEEMQQDITANAMFEKINSDNTLTLYINFETGQSTIKSESQNSIDTLYDMLKNNPDLKILIEGHTDNIGDEKSNKKLSEQRAASIKTKLVSKGITADRINTAGFGQTKPIADNATEEGKSKNRRVEIRKQ